MQRGRDAKPRRCTVLTEVDVGTLDMERLLALLDDEEATRVRAIAVRAREALAGRTVWNVNSTARGGGVAEMLLPLSPTRAARASTRAGS